jgi:hypothetical protein
MRTKQVLKNQEASMKEKPWLKHYESHVPHSIVYPEISIQRILLDTAANYPVILFSKAHKRIFTSTNASVSEMSEEERLMNFWSTLPRIPGSI